MSCVSGTVKTMEVIRILLDIHGDQQKVAWVVHCGRARTSTTRRPAKGALVLHVFFWMILLIIELKNDLLRFFCRRSLLRSVPHAETTFVHLSNESRAIEKKKASLWLWKLRSNI